MVEAVDRDTAAALAAPACIALQALAVDTHRQLATRVHVLSMNVVVQLAFTQSDTSKGAHGCAAAGTSRCIASTAARARPTYDADRM